MQALSQFPHVVPLRLQDLHTKAFTLSGEKIQKPFTLYFYTRFFQSKSEISSSQSVVWSCHAVRMHPSRLPQSCHDSIINLSATPATLARKVKRSNSLPMCETIFMSRCYVSQRGMDLFTSSWPTPVVALPSVTFSWLPTYTAFPRFSTVGRLSRSASDHEIRDS